MAERPFVNVYTIAYAWVLFENLIYKGVAKKHNRKLLAILCILITFKSIESFGGFKANEELFKRLHETFKEIIGD